jgi:1,2-phenylacetyl-CoA epoxidase catalytic subunit
VEHADAWFWRMARGGDEARRHLRAGLDNTFGEALWVFEPTPGEDAVVRAGLLPIPSRELLRRWLEIVEPMLTEAGFADLVKIPDDLYATPGGRHGVHTPDWTEDAWVEMTQLHREFRGTGALW